MRKIALAVLCLAAALSPAMAKDVPASPSTYVHNEGVLKNPEAVSRLLADFEKRTGHQMVVAFFQSLDGENLEAYSTRVFKTWKIGDKKRNDGLLFAAFLNDRKWRVEVGYGFEGTLTDIQAYDIATAAAVPHFKRGDFDSGVQSVVSALQSTLTAGRTAAAPVRPQPVTPRTVPVSDGLPPWLLIALLIGGVVAVIALIAWLSDGSSYYSGGGGSYGGGSSSGGSSGGSSWGGSSSSSGGSSSSSGSFSGGGGRSGGGGASGGW